MNTIDNSSITVSTICLMESTIPEDLGTIPDPRSHLVRQTFRYRLLSWLSLERKYWWNTYPRFFVSTKCH